MFKTILDAVDCELYEFIRLKVDEIEDFQMIRYVDDLYIMFSADESYEELTRVYNTVQNAYSSILKKHNLALNTSKCAMKEISEISEELKKAQYDEYVNGIEFDLGAFFSGKLRGFLEDVYDGFYSLELKYSFVTLSWRFRIVIHKFPLICPGFLETLVNRTFPSGSRLR